MDETIKLDIVAMIDDNRVTEALSASYNAMDRAQSYVDIPYSVRQMLLMAMGRIATVLNYTSSK